MVSRERAILLGSIGAALVLGLIGVVLYLVLRRPAPAPPTPPPAPPDVVPTVGEIRAVQFHHGSLGDCDDDARGSCASECTQCMGRVATVSSGDPKCLDFWEEPANEERMRAKVGTEFAAPISVRECENVHPEFLLRGPTGDCRVTWTNRCSDA